MVQVWNVSNSKMSCRTKLSTAHSVTTAVDTSDHMISSVGEEGHVQVSGTPKWGLGVVGDFPATVAAPNTPPPI